MTLGKTNSNRSLPIDATTSKVHATSDSPNPARRESSPKEPEANKKDHNRDVAQQTTQPMAKSTPNRVQDNGRVNPDAGAGPSDRSLRQSGWFGWIAKGDEQSTQSTETPSAGIGVASKMTSPEVPANATATAQKTSASEQRPTIEIEHDTTLAVNQKRSWLQMLGGDSSTKAGSTSTTSEAPANGQIPDQPKTKSLSIPLPTTPKAQSQASSIETSPPPPLPGDSTKSAGWVFWSRDRKPGATTESETDKPHQGEIAISDTPTQSHPKRASISLPEEAKPDPKAIKKAVVKHNPKVASVGSVERPQTPTEPKNQKAPDAKVMTKAQSKNAKAVAVEEVSPRPASPAPSRRAAENLLLPAFHDTLHVHQSPTLLQQLGRLLYYTKEPELRHLSLVKDPPRIKNALAIGVHGYFPGAMVRTLLGQPTGTSIKFADMAAKSIRKWTNSRGYDCEVKTAALEGEGKIAERVELLWKLLLNWIDEIRKSDFVMVACHSQGVPVAVMLVAKLIQFGCVNAARVGICAMAGVSMGPFADYKSRWISGSAGELFEFSDPNSKVSQEYHAAIDTVLKSGARLTLVGSIDDQLVSLESSIFAPLTHPHINRAVLIDSRVHAPGFLSHLVGFVLKLRNLGVQDHGLIRELSSPLAGSLYSGEGHSSVYNDEAVYDMAVSFALETTALLGIDVTRRNIQSSSGNPYVLPFAMRGILEEEVVRSELREEMNQLLQQFDEWKPVTKALKDVKFRLEGVRSKL